MDQLVLGLDTQPEEQNEDHQKVMLPVSGEQMLNDIDLNKPKVPNIYKNDKKGRGKEGQEERLPLRGPIVTLPPTVGQGSHAA